MDFSFQKRNKVTVLAICIFLAFSGIAGTDTRITGLAEIENNLIDIWDFGTGSTGFDRDVSGRNYGIDIEIYAYDGVLGWRTFGMGGRIEIKNTNIVFYDFELNKEIHGNLYKTDKSAISTYYLQLSDGRILWNTKLPPTGTKRQHNGRDVVVINNRGITNDNVRIRKGPSVDFEYLEYRQMEMPYDVFSYVPKGVPIRVLARTENKVAIGEWNNHWYLILFEQPTHMSPVEVRAWAYAEFIDLN